MLWDIIQQVQIRDQRDYTVGLERRVKNLEKEMHTTTESLRNLTNLLEEKFGKDLVGISANQLLKEDCAPSPLVANVEAEDNRIRVFDKMDKPNTILCRQQRSRRDAQKRRG